MEAPAILTGIVQQTGHLIEAARALVWPNHNNHSPLDGLWLEPSTDQLRSIEQAAGLKPSSASRLIRLFAQAGHDQKLRPALAEVRIQNGAIRASDFVRLVETPGFLDQMESSKIVKFGPAARRNSQQLADYLKSTA